MRHFHDQIQELKTKVLSMSRLVQEGFDFAIQALVKKNDETAEQVFENEKKINQLEIEVDDLGHSLLALGQPMAVDLRLVTTVLKINTDLERIGDHVVNIAERVVQLMEDPESWQLNVHLSAMAFDVQDILKDALDAFTQGNIALAEKVLKKDDEVDAYNDTVYTQLEKLMKDNPASTSAGMKLVRIGHELERIGDLSNNIAENVLYMKQGKEVRHRFELL